MSHSMTDTANTGPAYATMNRTGTRARLQECEKICVSFCFAPPGRATPGRCSSVASPITRGEGRACAHSTIEGKPRLPTSRDICYSLLVLYGFCHGACLYFIPGVVLCKLADGPIPYQAYTSARQPLRHTGPGNGIGYLALPVIASSCSIARDRARANASYFFCMVSVSNCLSQRRSTRRLFQRDGRFIGLS